MSYSEEIGNLQKPLKGWGYHLTHRTKGDKVIWALVVLLALISMLVVYSATGSLAYKNYKGNTEIYLFKQVAFIILGIGIIYFAHLVNYIIYSKIAQLLFLLSIPLLIYTLFFGLSMNEGSCWIRLPIIGMNLQRLIHCCTAIYPIICSCTVNWRLVSLMNARNYLVHMRLHRLEISVNIRQLNQAEKIPCGKLYCV